MRAGDGGSVRRSVPPLGRHEHPWKGVSRAAGRGLKVLRCVSR